MEKGRSITWETEAREKKSKERSKDLGSKELEEKGVRSKVKKIDKYTERRGYVEKERYLRNRDLGKKVR